MSIRIWRGRDPRLLLLLAPIHSGRVREIVDHVGWEVDVGVVVVCGHVCEVDGGGVVDGFVGTGSVKGAGCLLLLFGGVVAVVPAAKGLAVDSAHGDAEGSGLEDVVVGEAVHELGLGI